MWFVLACAIQLITVSTAEVCETANWRDSLVRQGWSVCPKTNTYIKGFGKGPRLMGDERIGRIEEGKCCEADNPIYANQPANCTKVKDWKSTLHEHNITIRTPHVCPNGYFLNGLRLGRGRQASLLDIEEGQCCRPQNHPDSYEGCIDVTSPLGSMGWSECDKKGYYITGFYKIPCNSLYCIEKVRCCKMNEVASINGSRVTDDGRCWNDGDWGECSVTCGGGIQYRKRTCRIHSGQRLNGGTYCTRTKLEVRSCNTRSCEEPCPEGWVFHELYCYLIIDTPTYYPSDARKKCQKFGAHLPKITSATQNQFIFDLLLKQNTETDYGVWLGLHRKEDMKFYWADGTPLTGYTAWAAAQPSLRKREKCVNMYGLPFGLPSYRGKWNDVRCGGFHEIWRAPVILCQKHFSSPTLLGN